jgi:hypothetical protein
MFAVRIELMQALEIRSGAIMAPAALQRHPATIEQLGMIRPDCQSRSKPAKVSWRRPGGRALRGSAAELRSGDSVPSVR